MKIKPIPKKLLKMDLSMSDEFINSYIDIRRTYRFLKILSNQTIDNSAK